MIKSGSLEIKNIPEQSHFLDQTAIKWMCVAFYVWALQ
jgi:hypothetical protein